MPKVLISWTEPACFGARTRTRTGWILRLLLALVVFVGMMIGWYADQRGGGGLQIGPVGGVLMSLGIALFLTAMLEFSQIGRSISISDDSVSMIGFTAFISMGTWALGSIRHVELLRPEEMGKPFGAMILHRAGKPVMLGVPAEVSPAKIAAVVHSLRIPVSLSGWSPDSDEDKPAPAIVPPPEAAAPLASARRWTEIPLSGQVLSGLRSWIALAVCNVPALAGVLYAVGMLVYLYFARHGMPTPRLAVLGGSALGALLLAGLWIDSLASFFYNRWEFSRCKGVLRRRGDCLVSPDDPAAAFVGIVPRANWTPLARDRLSDVGLLRVDHERRSILFEGANERWEIPADALRSCDVERIAGAQGEGDAPDGRFVVVLGARIDEADWEAPVFPKHLALGKGLGKKSGEAARALQASILDLLPPERRAPDC
ncbi:MAG TPA: hypothetical protein VMY37_02020 [Thermoguttaceae bacterium]|nr:hypothetical protein [Thermoguttaceae bacterium]